MLKKPTVPIFVFVLYVLLNFATICLAPILHRPIFEVAITLENGSPAESAMLRWSTGQDSGDNNTFAEILSDSCKGEVIGEFGKLTPGGGVAPFGSAMLSLGTEQRPDSVESIEDLPRSIIGITGENGILRFGHLNDVVQQQPLWSWPLLGQYRFKRELTVYHDGVETVVNLAALFPNMPLSQKVGKAVIVLHKD